ncbi:hypothetical protein FPV67DRAFT_1419763 [Lyophyllum atratum]|nr:hypothetical protein FPV67DRAFT_1419763 [Lyophyllum atratum]
MAAPLPRMPARGAPTAPVFSQNGPELNRFFDDLEALLQESGITDGENQKTYACRYVDMDTYTLWTNLTEYPAPTTYAEWKKAVLALYPGTSQDRRYSMHDLDLLTGERNRAGIYSLEDLASYYRSFLSISVFLISRNRLTDRERDHQFKRGFRDEFWARIAHRLEIVQPNHDLETPYSMDTIKTAAEYILKGPGMLPPVTVIPQNTSPGAANTYIPPYLPPTLPPAVIQNPPVSVKTEDLSYLIQKLAETIDRLGNQSNGNAGNTGRTLRPGDCTMCGQPGHFINECPEVEAYTQQGKCRRNAEGRVVLPSGAYIPRAIRGRNLKERFDEYHRQNPGNLAAGLLTANANPVGQMMLEIKHLSTVSTDELTREQRIEALERELLTLRTSSRGKQVFDGVEILRRKPVTRQAATRQSKDKGKGKKVDFAEPERSKTPTPPESNPAASEPSASTTAHIPSKAPVHPFSGIPDNRYVPPTSRNLGAVDKNNPAYRTYAPIVDPTKSGDLFNRCLGSQVTVSVEELCSVAPEIRGKFREAVTPKRLTTSAMASVIEEVDNTSNADVMEALPFCSAPPQTSAIVISDPYETYLNALEPGDYAERLIVAKESHSLRSIHMLIDNQREVECIVDSGCQIIAMSEEVCHDFGIKYDPTIILNMQSANGTIDKSLGLARNVPCALGTVTLYLQIHVIRNPAYDILLGRPFDVVTRSTVKTLSDDDTIITITDPNTDTVVSIPTFPRGRRRRTTATQSFRLPSRM